jgi:3-dehydroquinate dehydratase I
MRASNAGLDLRGTRVVGTIHEPGGFSDPAIARVDAVEVRADCLPVPPGPDEVGAPRKPVILTIRSRAEGGARDIPDSVRRDLYLELLPFVAAVDIEATSLRPLAEVVARARALRRPVIASFHDFQGVPQRALLRRRAARARSLGASCVKVAANLRTAEDLARLLGIFLALGRPSAVMGMGPLGRLSRLVFARCGSALNYGWLGKPQVPGQWPASEMAALLARLA